MLHLLFINLVVQFTFQIIEIVNNKKFILKTLNKCFGQLCEYFWKIFIFTQTISNHNSFLLTSNDIIIWIKMPLIFKRLILPLHSKRKSRKNNPKNKWQNLRNLVFKYCMENKRILSNVKKWHLLNYIFW